MTERMWCRACGTVTRNQTCDCHFSNDKPDFVNYADALQEDMQQIMKINNRLREVLLEAKQFINDAPLGDEAHAMLATIDATVC